MWIILIILLPFIIAFIIGVYRGLYDGFTGKNKYNPLYSIEQSEDAELSDIINDERIENYDRQIDACTQLIKNLDILYKNEVNPAKKATILKQQLTALEKLNKTIEKREKLDH